jgi:DNA primase
MNNRDISYQKKVDSLHEIIDLCHSHLFAPASKQVLSYLRNERGLSNETIRTFKLGAFPRYADVVATSVGSYTAWKCKVIGFDSNQGGAIVSPFSTHKVLIPIYDHHNDPVAIMGRSMMTKSELDKLGLPKYINTSYRKSGNLYGLNLAKDVIRKRDEVYLVEGNFDVITAHQNGFKNVVATSKASVSKMQLVLASRYAKHIKILFDNDQAGQEGAQRSLNHFQHISGVELSEVFLPQSVKDIDELFLKGMTYNDQDV